MVNGSELNVLGVTYKIVEVPCISKEEFLLGQVDHVRQVISVDAELTEQRKKVVLLHEILHCIFYALGYDEEHNDERLVQGLASALYQVLQQNNKLF